MSILAPTLLGAFSTWLTPVWILGVGALLGLVLMWIIWGLATLTGIIESVDPSPPSAGTGNTDYQAEGTIRSGPAAVIRRMALIVCPTHVMESVLWPIYLMVVASAAISVVLTPMIKRPAAMVLSLTRMSSVGTTHHEFTIPPAPPATDEDAFFEPDERPIDVAFRRSEVREIKLLADEDLIVHTYSKDRNGKGVAFRLSAGEDYQWFATSKSESPFPAEDVRSLYVKNYGEHPAKLTLDIHTELPYPEARSIPITAISIVGLFGLFLLQTTFAPKESAIALSTSKSEVAQPLFFVAVTVGAFLILLFIWVPYNTFGEDVKMLKIAGLTLIKVLAIIIAVWGAGTSIAEEIEGRTALTVLSKPISRRQFVFGKFLGIIWTVALVFIILGALFLITVSYKVVYDARETANPDPTWQMCHKEMVRTIPGLVLFFLETVVLASLSVAISTRLNLLTNFIISFSVFVLGHLTPLIVNSALGRFEPIVFVGQLIAAVVPVLDHFSMETAVAAEVPVPLGYLVWSLIYCCLFSSVAMLLALTLFEDRDLA